MRLLRLAKGSWEVLAACDEQGSCQTLDFLESLEGGSAHGAFMLALLRGRVATHGPPRGLLSKQLQDEIYEFRHGQVRVLWFYDEGRVVVCTHAIWKQEQKLPTTEVKRAVELRRRYLDAKKRGTLLVETP